jgi:hypothetical protein
VYDRFEELLGLMAEGKPLTLPGPAAKAAAAVAAAAPKAQEAAVVAKSAATDAAAAAKGAATSAAAATEKMASEAAAGASEAAAAASKAAAGFFEQLKELGAKAAQDTMAMAQAIKVRIGSMRIVLCHTQPAVTIPLVTASPSLAAAAAYQNRAPVWARPAVWASIMPHAVCLMHSLLWPARGFKRTPYPLPQPPPPRHSPGQG